MPKAIHIARFLITFAIVIPAAGCFSAGNRNVVKVLNRVECNPSLISCSYQEGIEDLWDYCLKNGYTSRQPSQKVKSSRPIKELVKGTFQKTKTENKTLERTSENGIVYSKKTQGTANKEIKVDGFCIGSEYILE